MARLGIDICVSSSSPGRMLRRLAKLATAHVEARLAARAGELNLSYTQWIALKVIHDGIVTNVGELARELGITTGSATRLVDTLEEHRLLNRDRGSDDRRVVKLMLTQAGVEVTKAVGPDVVGAWGDIFEDVDQAEAEAFIATLAKLFAKAEQITEAEGLVA